MRSHTGCSNCHSKNLFTTLFSQSHSPHSGLFWILKNRAWGGIKGHPPRVLGQSVLDFLLNLCMWICVILDLSFWHLNWNWDRKSSVLKSPSKSHCCYRHHYCLESVVTEAQKKYSQMEKCWQTLFSPFAHSLRWCRVMGTKQTHSAYLSQLISLLQGALLPIGHRHSLECWLCGIF